MKSNGSAIGADRDRLGDLKPRNVSIMPKKLSEDEKLARWAKRLQKAADKAYAEGRISHFDYRDISFKALQAAKPRAFARVTGL